jgi:hypothetical protein
MNRIQTIRANTTGVRPAAGSNLPGVLYANWPDRQIGVVDSGKNPIDLLAVRVFSTTAAYAVGAYVVQGGFLYRANAAAGPGGFVPAQWDKVQTTVDITGAYLPISGGTLTGPLGVITAPPAGTTNALVTTAPITSGVYTFNAYAVSGGSGWKALGAGRAAFIGYDVSLGQFNFYTTASAAANANVTPAVVATIDVNGGLTAASVTSNGALLARSATYPSYNNASDFILNASTATRYLQWAANWYDGWSAANGTRNWAGFDGTNAYNCMLLDGAGNLTVRGAVNAGGAIISPSTVQGAAVASTGLLAASGNLAVSGQANVAGNVITPNTLQAGVVHSTGAGQVDGALTVNGNLVVGGSFSIGSFVTSTLTADTVYYNHFVSSTFYGHDYAFGWNGSGTRHRVDGGDQGYLVRSENMYEMQFTGSAVVGLRDGGAFYWPAYAALTREEAQAKADEAQADIARLKLEVQVLTRRLAALEAKL